MKQINQTTYHPVQINKVCVHSIRVTYCKESKKYLIEQVDSRGRLCNQRAYYYADNYDDMKAIRDLLIDYLNGIGAYPCQLAIVN